mgnify:CR=1 FL=1
MPAPDRGTALVTGGTGFTGHHLLPALAQAGYRTISLAKPGETRADKLLHRVGDLLQQDFLEAVLADTAPDIIIHLAAISFAGHQDLGELYRTNILGTRALLAAAAGAASRPRILLASSGGIYRPDSSRPLDEEAAIAPGNDYQLSKYAAELLADQFRDRLAIRVVRPFNYTGVGQSDSFIIPKIVRAYRHRDSVIRLGNIDVERDFSDVRDVVAAYVGLCEAPGEDTVNICSGDCTSPRAVLAGLARMTGHALEVEIGRASCRERV